MDPHVLRPRGLGEPHRPERPRKDMPPREGAARLDDLYPYLGVFLEARPPVDLERLALSNREEAQQFLLHYGYDLSREEDRAEVESVHREAVDFLARLLCPDPTGEAPPLEMPAEVAEPPDPLDVLVWASEGAGPRQAWSCAVLRVMHTASHARRAVPTEPPPEVEEQVLGPFRRVLERSPEGYLQLGSGPEAIPVVRVYFRRNKSRESVLLKLLNKPENVAYEMFDQVGVRIVVPHPPDALRALRFLARENVVLFANVIPTWTRNNLVDLERGRGGGAGPADPADGAAYPPAGRRENPCSGPQYRSIRFTFRRPVWVPNPARKWYDALRQRVARSGRAQDLRAPEARGPAPEPELSLNCPVEVQILDRLSHIRSFGGETSHSRYRARQLAAVRQRVLGSVLRLEG